MPVHHSTVWASVPALIVCLLLLATWTRGQSPVFEHEPVEHLKAHLPKKGDDIGGKLELFLDAPPRELKRKTAQMDKNLRKVLKDQAHVSTFLVKGSTVLAKRTAEGIEFNSTFLLPHAVLLPILSTTLPILLEGYKRDLLTNPMGEVLRGKRRENSNVKDYLAFSLHDLTTKLPQSGSSVDLNSPTVLSELNKRGKAAFFYLNTVLGSVAEDAWRDALISVAMDYSVFSDKGQMLTHFKDLSKYAEALGGDIVNFFEVSETDLYPVDGGHFLYGWWFNCPRSGRKTSSKDRDARCLAPFLPSNAMAVLHPVIRVYTVPKLNLHLMVANSDKSAGAPRTLGDILAQDKLVWDALYSVVDPSSAGQEEDKKKERAEEKDIGSDSGKEVPTEPPVATEEPAQETEQKEDKESVGDKKEEEEDKDSKEAPTQPPVKEEESAETARETGEPQATATAEDSEETEPQVNDDDSTSPATEEPVEPHTQEEQSEGADTPTEPPPPDVEEQETVKTATDEQSEQEEIPTELPATAEEKDPAGQQEPPPKASPAKEKKTAKETGTKTVAEDEVVGESTPRKRPGTAATQPPPVEREEDEVVEEEKVEKKEKQGRKEGNVREKPLLVWVIYKSWPVVTFLLYTILSHVWIYWIVHLTWLVCSTLFSGVHLPRPKTAKTD